MKPNHLSNSVAKMLQKDKNTIFKMVNVNVAAIQPYLSDLIKKPQMMITPERFKIALKWYFNIGLYLSLGFLAA